jgi:hypothetical protein
MKLKKGSPEAKRFMAKIRAMKSGTKKKATKKATKKIGATKFFENEIETKSSKPKRNISVTRRSDGTFKKFDDSVLQARRLRKKALAKKQGRKISGLHKDTKSHNVKISVVSGIKHPSFYDKDMAREISLYADNDADLYRQSRRPILINLSNKYKKGTFKVDLASKLWVYYIENALKKYQKEFGNKNQSWSTLMKPADRKLLAMEYAIDTLNEFNHGNFTEK